MPIWNNLGKKCIHFIQPENLPYGERIFDEYRSNENLGFTCLRMAS